MTDATNTPGYDPTDVEATQGREQGLGMGERDLNQQRDVGDTIAAPEEERDFLSADQETDEDASTLATEGAMDEEDTGYASDDDAVEDATDDSEVVEEDDL